MEKEEVRQDAAGSGRRTVRPTTYYYDAELHLDQVLTLYQTLMNTSSAAIVQQRPSMLTCARERSLLQSRKVCTSKTGRAIAHEQSTHACFRSPQSRIKCLSRQAQIVSGLVRTGIIPRVWNAALHIYLSGGVLVSNITSSKLKCKHAFLPTPSIGRSASYTLTRVSFMRLFFFDPCLSVDSPAGFPTIICNLKARFGFSIYLKRREPT